MVKIVFCSPSFRVIIFPGLVVTNRVPSSAMAKSHGTSNPSATTSTRNDTADAGNGLGVGVRDGVDAGPDEPPEPVDVPGVVPGLNVVPGLVKGPGVDPGLEVGPDEPPEPLDVPGVDPGPVAAPGEAPTFGTAAGVDAGWLAVVVPLGEPVGVTRPGVCVPEAGVAGWGCCVVPGGDGGVVSVSGLFPDAGCMVAGSELEGARSGEAKGERVAAAGSAAGGETASCDLQADANAKPSTAATVSKDLRFKAIPPLPRLPSSAMGPFGPGRAQ